MNPALTAGLSEAKDVALKVVRSKWFWVAVVLVILLIFVNRNWRKWKAKYGRDYGNYLDVTPGDVPNYRRMDLEELAQAFADHIDGAGFLASNIPSWMDFGLGGVATVSYDKNRDEIIIRMLELNDGELKYLAKYYRKGIGQGSLYDALEAEKRPTETLESLLNKLQIIGEV